MEDEEEFPVFDIETLLEELPQQYFTHPCYRFFIYMIQRSKRYGMKCDFTRGRAGFYRWLDIVGHIPEGMAKPSIGRYDHSKGYVFDATNNRWNFRWQERSENCRESGLRGAESGQLKKAQMASLNQINTCAACGRTKRGPQWRHHCDHQRCGWGAFPIDDVIELGDLIDGNK
jgi:hypothetical protein